MKAQMPRIGGRVWVAAWTVVLLLGIGFCVATRMSYTDYNRDPEGLARLPYLYTPASHQAVDPASDLTKSSDMVNTDELISATPIIVSGVFEGERAYGYRAFLSEVRITRVFRGKEVAAGQMVPVFEAAGIQRMSWLGDWRQTSPASYDAFAQRFDFVEGEGVPVVVRPTAGVVMHGSMLMGKGQEYLLFLYPKTYPEAEDRSGKPQEYLVENNPYALTSFPPGRSQTKTAVLDPMADFLDMQEAQGYSFVVSDPSDVSLYEQTARELVECVVQMQH